MSNFSKFKRGDRIETTWGSKGTVKDIAKKDGKFLISVELDSGMKTEYDEKDVKFYHKDIAEKKYVAPEHIGEKCPQCQTPWTITPFGANSWKDCIPCGKTAEELLDKSGKWNNSVDSDVEDWYNVLKGWGSD